MNLTRSIEPITLQADNYMNGYEQVFDILSKGNYSTTQALFVIPWTERLGIYRCECYRIGSIQEFENHVSRIYQQSKRQLPTIYLDKFHVDAANHWVVSSPKPNDMITDYISVGGFEHSIVVIFNSADKFEHNLAMRSTGRDCYFHRLPISFLLTLSQSLDHSTTTILKRAISAISNL